MIRRWLALTYYLYALRLAALSHFYFNPLYLSYLLAAKAKRKADNGRIAPAAYRFIDIAATLIECLLRLMFWIERKCGWIKPSAPKPTRMQTRLLGGVLLLLLLLLLGFALWR